ncbi:AAA family ATPase [Burkholderia multivorans]|nr:AAA family ATPase [Burkholderia multivorans]
MSGEKEIVRDILSNARRVVKMEPVRDGVILVNGADLKPEPISWLWHGWLARGKLHILAGAPGQGKTTIALAFAATVTTGGRWPDGSRCPAGNVLVWSGEDDPADTLLPRLLAAGADPKRVFFVTGSRIGGEVQSFDPARDMVALTEQCERIGSVRLIIVDPIVSVVTGDSHKNTETRRALQPLVDLASNMDAALLGITHFSKGGQGGDPTQRVVGSVAFTAVARVVLVAAKVKGDDGEDRRILARSKSNIGPDEGGFEYHLEQTEPVAGIFASRIAWGASVSGSARELLTDPNEQDDDTTSALDAAADFIQQVLGSDVVPSKSIEAEAKEAGISWASVRRASDSLGVKKRRGDGGKWYWSLPKSAEVAQLAHVAQPSNVEQVEQVANVNQSEG